MKNVEKSNFLLDCIDDRDDQRFDQLKKTIEGLSERDVDWIFDYYQTEVKNKVGYYIHEINDYGTSLSVMIVTGMTFLR